MELLKAYKTYDLETLKNTLNILDNQGTDKKAVFDKYCPEIVYEPSMIYSQKSLKTRSFKVRRHLMDMKPKHITVNMVYRTEHDAEPEPNKPVINSIRFSRLYVPETSIYGRLLIKLFISQLFMDGITPAVILTMYATRCAIYGNVSFVEHMHDPLPITEKMSKEQANSAIVQLLALFDVLELNGVHLMDADSSDFVLSQFRPRPSFRGLDISDVKKVRYICRGSRHKYDVSIPKSQFIRLINEYPASIVPVGEHAVIADAPIRKNREKTMIETFTRIVQESGLIDISDDSLSGIVYAKTFDDAFETINESGLFNVTESASDIDLIIKSQLVRDAFIRANMP